MPADDSWMRDAFSGGAQILRDRPRKEAEERANKASGKILRGSRAIKGKYLCAVCGFCCMHHDTPACEHGSCWIRCDDAAVWKALGGARRCRLCTYYNRGIMLDFTRRGPSYDQGRMNGINAQNFGTGTMEHVFLRVMREFRCL